MAENVTYPDYSYGIMPNDAFNKYMRFSTQRRATTGIAPSSGDKKAFWEGTMEGVIKNSAQRAAQNLENKRYEQSVINANRNYELSQKQLENQESQSNRNAISGLAQIPMTYMMYDALGLRKDTPGRKSLIEKGWDWTTNAFGLGDNNNFSDDLSSYYTNVGGDMGGYEGGIPYNLINDTDSGIDFSQEALNYMGDFGLSDYAIPTASDYLMDVFEGYPTEVGTSVGTDIATDIGSSIFDWGI